LRQLVKPQPQGEPCGCDEGHEGQRRFIFR
jgi:hypothetical protein